MFDIGWPELLVVAIVLIVVVGPKDLPRMLRAFGKTTSRMRSMAGEFRTQFEDALKEADLDDVRQTISDAQKLNPAKSFRDAMNPLRKAGDDIKAGLSDAVKPDSLSKPDAEDVEDVPDPAVDIASSTPPAETEAARNSATATPAALSKSRNSTRKKRPAATTHRADGAETSAKADTASKRPAASKGRPTKAKSAKAKPAKSQSAMPQPASAEDVREPASAGKAQAARTRSGNKKAVGTASGENAAKKAPAKKAPASKTGSRSKGGGGATDPSRATVKTASASPSGTERAGKADDDR